MSKHRHSIPSHDRRRVRRFVISSKRAFLQGALAVAVIIAAATHGASAQAQNAAPAVTATTITAAPTAIADHVERIRACGAEWKKAKAYPAVKEAGWPKYWSGCNARLRPAGAKTRKRSDS